MKDFFEIQSARCYIKVWKCAGRFNTYPFYVFPEAVSYFCVVVDTATIIFATPSGYHGSQKFCYELDFSSESVIVLRFEIFHHPFQFVSIVIFFVLLESFDFCRDIVYETVIIFEIIVSKIVHILNTFVDILIVNFAPVKVFAVDQS